MSGIAAKKPASAHDLFGGSPVIAGQPKHMHNHATVIINHPNDNKYYDLPDEALSLEERLRITLGLADFLPASRDRTGSGPEFRLSPMVVDPVLLAFLTYIAFN